MPTAREIALSVLPHFAANVLAGHVLPYGSYAHAIGRDPATESMVIGQTMHAIGAACILARIPVAPLHYVKRADDGWRGVFEADSTERSYVLPHYDVLLIAARAYAYSEKDFAKLDRVLRAIIPKYFPSDYSSPHDLWHFVVLKELTDSSTFFRRAVASYEQIIAKAKPERSAHG